MLIAYLAAFAASPAQCAPPRVLLSDGDKSLTVRFWYDTPARREVEANVRAAFKAACQRRLLTGGKIAKLGGVSSRTLYLFNAPEANVASLYVHKGRLLLEYPFVASDKSVNVPKPAEIQEAIYCAVVGVTEKEQEESGRCLPD